MLLCGYADTCIAMMDDAKTECLKSLSLLPPHISSLPLFLFCLNTTVVSCAREQDILAFQPCSKLIAT